MHHPTISSIQRLPSMTVKAVNLRRPQTTSVISSFPQTLPSHPVSPTSTNLGVLGLPQPIQMMIPHSLLPSPRYHLILVWIHSPMNQSIVLHPAFSISRLNPTILAKCGDEELRKVYELRQRTSKNEKWERERCRELLALLRLRLDEHAAHRLNNVKYTLLFDHS